MKIARKLPAALLPALIMLLVAAGRGQAAVKASGAVDYARIEPAGGVLLADHLSVVGGRLPVRGAATWTALANMTQAVKQVNGGGYHLGTVYIPGGVINSTGPALHGFMSYYTIATNNWRVDPQPMPVSVADAAICTDNAGKVHVINGFDSAPGLVSAHQIYNPAAPAGSRWSSAGAPSVAGSNYFSQGSGCVVINHTLYLFGGYGVIGAGAPAALGTTWAWDKNTDTWSDTGFTMSDPRYWMGYGQKTNNGYAAGGTDGALMAMSAYERFDPGTGWTPGGSLPLPLLAPGLVGTEAGVLVFGGGTPSGGSYALQNTTYLCPGSCPPSATTWSDTGRYLLTARWFAGWAGGPPDGPFIAGGINTVSGLGALKSSERFQLP